MSNGKLCNAEIVISKGINRPGTIIMHCDLYEGHEGDCSKMIYHAKKREDNSGIIDNYRLGRITWKKELSEKGTSHE